MAPLAEALLAAARRVARVAAGHSLDAWSRSEDRPPVSLRGAVDDLCFGTLRAYGRVQAVLAALVRRRDTDAAVEALLWCALYALASGRYQAYAAVDQAVRACEWLGRPGSKPFVNAVLRSYLRQQRSLEERLAADPVAHWQHPAWWIMRVRADHPSAWQGILAAGNSHPPMCLRVNLRRTSLDDYGKRLAAQGIVAHRRGVSGLLLERPVPIARLPGFAAGEVSVQDAAAQRAAPLLDLRAGQRVLDACAAPGGKTAHILETAPVDLTALELRASRAAPIVDNLTRLGLQAEVRVADCCATRQWWDGRAFDRILADVPCTASGVARRHPDIKWLRRDTDVAEYAARQIRILRSLWGVLAPGGKLLYVTCSVFREENDAVVEAFLADVPGAVRSADPDAGTGQVLPSSEEDGFFLARLDRVA